MRMYVRVRVRVGVKQKPARGGTISVYCRHETKVRKADISQQKSENAA